MIEIEAFISSLLSKLFEAMKLCLILVEAFSNCKPKDKESNKRRELERGANSPSHPLDYGYRQIHASISVPYHHRRLPWKKTLEITDKNLITQTSLDVIKRVSTITKND